MHLQTQISGQISGQVPSQTGLHLPSISQQNGNPLVSQMQPGDFRNSSRMDSDISMARKCVQDRIIQFFLQRNSTPEMQQRIPEIARRLDERLFNDASSIEEYMNMDSLERRLAVLIQRVKKTGQQRQSSSHSSSSVGTMIPTPGMTPIGSGNSTSLALGDNLVKTSNTVVPVTANSVSLSPTANGSNNVQGGSFNGSGSLTNGYQQSPINIPMGPSQTNILRSTGAPNVGTQMIPTPGLNNAQSMQMNMERSTSSLAKQYFGNKNGRVMQNIGSPMCMGMGSSPQQNTSAYGFLNESIGQPLIENDVHVMNGTAVSEEYRNASQYGDMHKMNGPYSAGSGNLSCSPSTVGSTMSNQNLNPGSLQLTSNTNSGMLSHQRSVVVQQPTQMKSITSDQSKKVNLQSGFSNREQVAKSQQQMGKFQEQQFQQSYTHFVQHQHQQPVQYQQHQQPLLRNDILRKPQPASNVGIKNMADHSMAYCDDGLHSHMSEQYHVSESQEHYMMQSTGNEVYPKGDQMVYNSSEFQDVHASSQSEASRQGQWHAQSLENRGEAAAHLSTSDQKFQDEFRQRIAGQDEAQQPHSSFGGSAADQSIALKGGAVREGTAAGELKDVKREQDYKNQQRWLLFLRHARSCSARKGNCQEATCHKAQELWKHMIQCKVKKCTYPRCSASKALIDHDRQCKAVDCPVCIPVQTYLAMQRSSQFRPTADTALRNSQHGNFEDGANVSRIPTKNGLNTIGTSEEYQSSIKRMKVEHSSPQNVHEGKPNLRVLKNIEVPVDEEVMEMKQEQLLANAEVKTENLENVRSTKSDMTPSMDNEHSVQIKNEKAVVDREEDQIEVTVKQELAKATSDPVAGTKSVKPKIKGVSLTELFTPEQVREHIRGLRQWVGQSKAKVEKNQAIGHIMSENSCQLCGVEKLTFEPPPIYCSTCGSRIKRNAMYYTMGSGDTRHCFCIPCHNEARGDSIEIDGNAISKSRLEKKKNDDETEEGWAQCDKCEAWQHQVCALFNIRRNDGGKAEYTCPNCFILEVERGERKPLPQNAVLGAKDLPKTVLSDHIEQRLARKLKQERLERARLQGKNFEEVPGAEALVVRVVLSVDKKVEVKQRFLEIFQEENYPTEFPYKSKVILLFQKIEGVEVCLFGMYVQEFGSECSFPNQRRVYLSYLDSVKYFRPDIRTVSGEALRTFVYQEILIGYLEYCKRRGFTSCYIWACPPLKGEDYILYCHPEIQKTPKSDKLREWYLSMLRKASKEKVVVDLTNLYDHFFVSLGECKAKVTAARLPYFDGDYWPGAAEDMINQLRQEEDGGKQQKKGKTKKIITKRALKAAGHTDLSCNASKDALLMQKLGETIFPMKEDFIMVHLQHACTHCCHLMVFGKRWVCGRCKNFQLCDKCYEGEQKREERERHPVNSREKHMLSPVEIDDVPADTKDRDEILDSEFFDTRQAFLSLCQGNHYQYDTLRRAKHSSMMVLYHLHNPTAPAFVTTCNICRRDIETGQGWRCEVCPDFDICNVCYQRDGGTGHPHTLTSHPSMAERDAQNQEARQQRVLQLRKMLDLLVHASQCRSAQCKYPNCRQVKGLFRHGMQCRTRATGGCVLCKKMWYLLQLHARACKESDCRVPRCKDLKEHMKRLQQQSDSRRRAAVMEMMRQRAAERKMG